jgi:hypothetical protein
MTTTWLLITNGHVMGIFFFLSVVEVKDIKVTLDKYLRDSEKKNAL